MAALAEVAERCRCAIIGVRHLRKGQGSWGKPLYRGAGSIDLTAASRSVLMVQEDEEAKQRGEEGIERKISHIKCNVAEKGRQAGVRRGQGRPHLGRRPAQIQDRPKPVPGIRLVALATEEMPVGEVGELKVEGNANTNQARAAFVSSKTLLCEELSRLGNDLALVVQLARLVRLSRVLRSREYTGLVRLHLSKGLVNSVQQEEWLDWRQPSDQEICPMKSSPSD